MDNQTKGTVTVAGIGPGSPADTTPAVLQAVSQSDVVVGYKPYFRYIAQALGPDTICIDTGMKQERERAQQAIDLCLEGHRVCVISSGEAGIYGMAPLIYEMTCQQGLLGQVDIVTLPGISAFQKAGALLGAPLGHDLCLISLSDLMTPWKVIERRITAAAQADFVTCIYNPRSHGRYWQLNRLVELFLRHRSPDTPVGYVKQAGREGQQVTHTTLAQFDPDDTDMFTLIIIGNSQTYIAAHHMITPRGYYRDKEADSGSRRPGQDIMIQSFRTIASELDGAGRMPLGYKWALLHAIHTTADFDMKNLLYTDPGAVELLHQAVAGGHVTHIVTDVTMAQAGIRKGALQRLGIETVCYINDLRTVAMARELNITRAAAAMRLAAQEHPAALYVFGNAPTALLELCDLIRRGKAQPAGMICAPVGFVHVEESKHAAKVFRNIPKIIVEGRKGGSNLAATLCNAVLTFDDAATLRPGRDV